MLRGATSEDALKFFHRQLVQELGATMAEHVVVEHFYYIRAITAADPQLPLRKHPIDVLWDHVEKLVKQGYYHKRRGFRLETATLSQATNHVIEEAIELQAEALDGDSHAARVSEAGDLLAVFVHLLQMLSIPIGAAVSAAQVGLEKNFVRTEAEVTANKPGVTRSGRPDKSEE